MSRYFTRSPYEKPYIIATGNPDAVEDDNRRRRKSYFVISARELTGMERGLGVHPADYAMKLKSTFGRRCCTNYR